MPYSGTMNNTMKVDTVSGYTMTTNSTLTFTLDPKVTPYIHLTDMMTQQEDIKISTSISVNETSFLNQIYPINGTAYINYTDTGVKHLIDKPFIYATSSCFGFFLILSVTLFLFNRHE